MYRHRMTDGQRHTGTRRQWTVKQTKTQLHLGIRSHKLEKGPDPQTERQEHRGQGGQD